MNHSNKDGKPLAESAEERPLIKENARQPNTYPTQSGKGVSQGLANVRKAARDDRAAAGKLLLTEEEGRTRSRRRNVAGV
jgi:hypothetical protein